MRTFVGRDGINIHHNGDFSGNAIICKPNEEPFEVPFYVLRAFVAEQVRNKKIAALEQASSEELLR